MHMSDKGLGCSVINIYEAYGLAVNGHQGGKEGSKLVKTIITVLTRSVCVDLYT